MNPTSERGYTLLLSMMALLMVTAISSMMVMSTYYEVKFSRTTRSDLQAHYLAEAGADKALTWFNGSYSLIGTASLNTGPSTPPTVTDLMGRTFTAPVSLLSGSALLFNGYTAGTATTHPASYTNTSGTSVTDMTTSFQNALSSKTMSFGADGSGTYSVMATLLGVSPERWRIDSIGTFNGKQEAISVYFERLTVDPTIDGAMTSASPVDVTGHHTIDGRDHDMNGLVIAGAAGLPGVSTTSANPFPTVSGSGAVISNVDGTTPTTYTGGTPPDPVPSNYPVNNTQPLATYPYSPAGALGLDPAQYNSYLDSKAVTSVPCTIQGLVVLDLDFPMDSAGGGCSYGGTGILIIHNPRYDPRYFDPADPLYSSSTSPISGQTAAQYRADTANRPRYFNYNGSNTFKGIIIADSIGEIGPGITGNADIIGALISLDRVNGSVGSGHASINYSSASVSFAISTLPYTKRAGSFRQLTSN